MPNSITLKHTHMIIGNYKVNTVASSELNFCEGGLGVCGGGGGNDSRVFLSITGIAVPFFKANF